MKEFKTILTANGTAIAGSLLLLPDFKSGYVFAIGDDQIDCLLHKDFEADDILVLKRNVLSERQEELLMKGSVIRWDKANNKIEFLSESGQIWL